MFKSLTCANSYFAQAMVATAKRVRSTLRWLLPKGKKSVGKKREWRTARWARLRREHVPKKKKNLLQGFEKKKIARTFAPLLKESCMEGIAQLVRVSDCDSEGRRFKPGYPPRKQSCIKFFDAAFAFLRTSYGYFTCYFFGAGQGLLACYECVASSYFGG